ncbi:MAG: AmmeMemoRadiSam system protein B, partial [Deltaproteobacteria bacterium]
VVEMEERFLLDTEKYRRALERAVEEYSLLPSRPPSHAGTAYPAGREEAEEFVKKILGEGERGAVPENVAALVVPHIDLRVGGPAYGVAYSAVRNMDVDSVLLLCTGHYLGEDLFCLTRKDFETPFGVVKTDREAVDFLWRGKGIAPSDFPFRFEHSVAFQVLFLSYVFRRKDFAVVPVLCGNFSRFLDVASRPSQIPAVALFLTRLRKILSSPRKRWLVVAGVDLSHVGPKFGHRDPAKFMEYQFREHDRVLLDALERGDPEGFFGEVKKVGDRYNVCGFSSLALLLELFEGFRGKTLHYDVWYDTPTLSAVSFAASILHRGREG